MATFQFVNSHKEITCISDLIGEVRRLYTSGAASVWLRGQTDYSKLLVPTIGRKHKFAGNLPITFNRRQERNLLHRFRRYAYPYYGRVLNEWEGLFLARHHGLPVRLLDWTSDPLAALYFASEKKPKKHGAVWAFLRRSSEKYDIDVFDQIRRNTDPLKIKGIKILYPFHISPRMSVQTSAFTIQDNPWKDLRSYARKRIPQGNLDIVKLLKWKVPKENKTDIIEELEHAAVNQRTLFPDLDGLAKGLWQTEVLRRIK